MPRCPGGSAVLIAVPLAYFTVRFRFRGAALIQTLGVLPLVMPAFVGASAMQLLFGRSGSVNLILSESFGFTLPIMEGLSGVIFVETGSHGGYLLSPAVNERIPAPVRRANGYYEQDIEAALCAYFVDRKSTRLNSSHRT